MQREKKRVYILARELNVDTKSLLELCKQAGFDVKNQLSVLEPEQQDELEQLAKKGPSSAPTPSKSAKPVLRAPVKSVPTLAPARQRKESQEPEILSEAVASAEEPAAAPPAVPEPAAAEIPEPEIAPAVPEPELPAAAARTATVEAPPPSAPEPPLPPAETRPETPVAPRTPPTLPSRGPVRSLPGAGGRSPGRSGGRTPPRPSLHPGMVARPPQTSLTPAKPLKPAEPKEKVAKPIAKMTPEMMQEKRPLRPEDLLRPQQPVVPVEEEEEDASGKGKGGKGSKDSKDSKKLKEIPGRDSRQRARNERAEKRKSRGSEVEIRGHNRVVGLDEDGPSTATRIRERRKHRPPTLPRKGNVVLDPPITVRSLSEALGIRSVELLFKLRDHGAAANTNINSTLEIELAEVLALEYGIGIEIRRPLDAEEQVLAQFDQPDDPEALVPRAPIVTIMGHVDHGKTTLLDKIRASNIVATEAGGITQVIRAWRVEHHGKPVTFLDTPGHEAFTKMRARGAQVTDIAVIVVAADDGVMPQTEEAIQHAKAAGVSLVVAINKIDMPNANINKARQQLYSLDVLPDDMGGDTPFVETSGATGKGIDELLEQISIVAELKELKANPAKPARGTCLEAMLSEGEGVRATLLVRDGTLRRGDLLLCGGSYGRIRQMVDDLGRPLEEAGPSVPVRITGLDEVPEADDPFVVLPDLAVAREIADKRRLKKQEAGHVRRTPLTLENLTQAKIDELKVILKADFRGSIEAIRKELDKLQHEEVRVRILEAAIGAITETDVWLALASPADTMIVGFNVVPDDRARELADEKGVQIRLYDIIYNLTDDVRAALEGRLKPREEVVHLGRAVVRETFKISRVGTIAGCYVTQGNIRRNAKVRLIREGIVIYPPAERSAGLESLKRFKEDVAEVREGFECGIKIAGYDDVKVGDVIEAFRVEQVQRTLD